MKRPSEIVSIGQGLCRLTVRSSKQRDLYARLPGIRIDDRDAEHLGYRVIFPERMRGLIESTLKKEEREEKPPQPVQMQLSLPNKRKGGGKTRRKHVLSKVEGGKVEGGKVEGGKVEGGKSKGKNHSQGG